MSVQLLTEHHLEFISLKKKATQARLSLHLSKCHIVGNHMSWLNYKSVITLVMCEMHILNSKRDLSMKNDIKVQFL